jgi:excisionase family DNA binding protein
VSGDARAHARETLAGFVSERMLAALEQLVEAVVDEREHARQPAQGSRWLTVAEAAEYAGCDPQRIYDLRSERRLERHGDGRRALVDRQELDAYLARSGNSR